MINYPGRHGSNAGTHPVRNEAAKYARPAIERGPDENSEGQFALRIPDCSQNGESRSNDCFKQSEEETGDR